MSWLERIFGRRHLYDELGEEVLAHLEEKTEQLMRLENLSRTEARQAALRAFGNPTLIETRSREVWEWPALESLLADLKLAFRRLGKSPSFAATVLLTLAIGIGANTAVFSVVNGVLLKPLPYPDSDRLVSLDLNAPGAAGLAGLQNGLLLSPSMYFIFSENNRTFQSLGAWGPWKANVTGLERPEVVNVIYVTDGVLESLAVPPLKGRLLTGADQTPNSPLNVVVSYGYWQRCLGGDSSVIGRILVVSSQVTTIVGVMPRGFRIVGHEFDILMPSAYERNKLVLAGFGLNGIGRLKPGVTIPEANADIARTIPIWLNSFSGVGSDANGFVKWRIAPDFLSLKQEVIGNVSSVLWVVMGMIGLVLLIACMNVGNLLLVRAEGRQLELSIRAALGAGRARIARELLLESALLGLLGGALGIGVAAAALRLLVSIGPAELPRINEVSLDARALLFTLVLSLLCGLLLGTIPAWKYSRNRATVTLVAGRTVSPGRQRLRSQNVLVVGQVAMALVLLICAALMIRTFQQLLMVQPGFTDASSLQTFHILIPDTSIADPRMVTRVQYEIAEKLGSIPGVTSAGFAGTLPMEGLQPFWSVVYAEGRTYQGAPPLRLFNYVSPGYLHALGTRLIAGREFTRSEIDGFEPKAIVSEGVAREEWGSADAAIGNRIRALSRGWFEVIGVAQDVRYNGVDESAPATVYYPARAGSPWFETRTYAPRSMAFAVRSKRAGTQVFIKQIEDAVSSVNADLPVASFRTMQEIESNSLARTTFTLVMLGIAASMALALGTIGTYGVISYSVSQRTREIGIRMALGAKRRELRWMFVRSALALTGIGIVIGLGAAVVVARLMRTLLFGVSPLDPVSFAVVLLTLVAAAALASFLPARQAAATNPVDALRAE
jgi:predicted permease